MKTLLNHNKKSQDYETNLKGFAQKSQDSGNYSDYSQQVHKVSRFCGGAGTGRWPVAVARGCGREARGAGAGGAGARGAGAGAGTERWRVAEARALDAGARRGR